MAQFHWQVTDSQTGQPIANAYINAFVNTTPGPWFTCSSTPGYPIQTYTDSSGNATATIEGTCPQTVGGTISANGYDDQPINESTGDVTGDVWFNIKMSPGNNVTNTPPGQGFGAGTQNLLGNFASNPVEVFTLVFVVILIIGTIGAVVWLVKKK